MNLIRYLLVVVLVMVLAACGGGGGNPGTTSGGTTSVAVNSDPILRGVLQDAAGTTTSSISASGYTVLSVILTDPSGRGIPDQVISATGDATKVVFPEGSGGLTNASGVAIIKVARASLFATGADTLTVTYSYKAGSLTTYPDGSAPPTVDKVVARYVGYQLSASNISLTNLNLGAPTLAAYGTRQVSVQANINGVAASSAPVQVSFSANCGAVTPATASTNSQGVVQVSYSANNAGVINDQGCSGSTVSIVASTTGATPVTGNLIIELAPATNLLFVDAKPTTIFLAGSGGATQSIVRFRLVNASNAPLLGQDILLELKDLAGGIPKTSFGTVGNVAAITQSTTSSGEVSVPVFSGTVPTNVSVKATLVSNVNVTTTSAVLAIASGRAVQSRVSLAVENLSIEGANVDGVTTQVTMSLADRQGNPVPDGTAINFVTEGGVMIPPVCTTGAVPGDSRCTVSIRSQNPRPANGLVSILAYAAGEEDFVDLNFDNAYTAGEPFTDLGNAFRDDAALVGGVTGPYVAGYFSVPRAGSVACGGGFLGRPNSCDGVWGAVDVRRQANVIFATSIANIVGSVSANTLTVTISDQNGNSMPTGSTVEASGSIGNTGGNFASCTIQSERKFVVFSTTAPSNFSFTYVCDLGDILTVKVTTPTGIVTTRSFTAVGEPFVCTAPLVAQNGECVAPDTTPPTFPAGDPSVDLITPTSFRLTAMINEAGTGYYLLQNRTVSPAVSCPSVSALILSGTTVGMSGNTPTAVSFPGTTGTSYAICFVARDSAGNTQTTVKTVGPFMLP